MPPLEERFGVSWATSDFLPPALVLNTMFKVSEVSYSVLLGAGGLEVIVLLLVSLLVAALLGGGLLLLVFAIRVIAVLLVLGRARLNQSVPNM